MSSNGLGPRPSSASYSGNANSGLKPLTNHHLHPTERPLETVSRLSIIAESNSRSSSFHYDRIDFLDTSDPWGLGYHHGSPYDALTGLSQRRRHFPVQSAPTSPRQSYINMTILQSAVRHSHRFCRQVAEFLLVIFS